MAKIWVDGREYEVDGKRNLLDVCLSLGLNLPYFCWHPALGSVGACRQCAVKQYKDENDTRGRLVMACMTPAAEGTRISINDPDAADFRRRIIEGLMLNHPHDCPVCDEGGQCHLQDMTVMTGHDYRRYRFTKRTFRNQYLGPFLNHEMNRCIQCYRCVRYYREYAGGNDLNSFVLRDIVYFGRSSDGVLENEFAGNLAEVCPTGVFTDKTLGEHYTRKWDQTYAPSVCTHCGNGCNISPGERYGTLRRVVNRYNSEVNGYFLCDRGRFGYEFVNSDRRIREPLWKGERVARDAAVEHLGALIGPEAAVVGIGSPRASLESNFALREVVGPDRFFIGMADDELRLCRLMLDLMRRGPAHIASMHDIERSDAVLVVGEDVLNTAPRMALALRQSVRQQPLRHAERLKIPAWNDHAVRDAVQGAVGPLFVATPAATRIDDIAAAVYRAAPDDIARLGFAVAAALGAGAPAVDGLPQAARDLAGRIADALRAAQRPLVIAGPSLRSEAVIHAAANIARALSTDARRANLAFVAPEANSFGLAMMGGRTLGEALETVRGGGVQTLIVLENDLYRRLPAQAAGALCEAPGHLVALDSVSNATTEKADLVLPAGTFAESDGTLVNNEARAQRFFQVYVPRTGAIQDSGRWLRDAMLAGARTGEPEWASLDDAVLAVANSMPQFATILDAAPSSKARFSGVKAPREPHRFSGRTAILANINVHEPKPPDDPDSPLSFTMEGMQPPPAGPVTPFFWAPGWTSIQAVNKFQEEIAGPLRGGDAGVRLIEAADGLGAPYVGAIPAAFQRRDGEFLAVPLYHIFGSDELSALAPAVASLAPWPYIALNAEDAARLGLNPDEVVEIGAGLRLPLRVMPELPPGIAGLPVLPAIEPMQLPAWTTIARAS